MHLLQPLLFFAVPQVHFQEVIEVAASHSLIRIRSVIDEAKMDFEYPGEYAFKDETHLIVYTDYTGNLITKCAIQANTSGMLLHRSGAFSGDMFFSLTNPTFVDYQADMLAAKMIIHTYRYELIREEHRLMIVLEYHLSAPEGKNRSTVDQTIEILFGEMKENRLQ